MRKGSYKVVKVNIDEEPTLAQQYDVQSIPLIGLFRNGRLDLFGAKPRPTRSRARDARHSLTIVVTAPEPAARAPGSTAVIAADRATWIQTCGMSHADLITEVMKLREGSGPPRQHGTGPVLAPSGALGAAAGTDDPIPEVPEWPQFMRGCVMYRQSLDEQAPDAPRTDQAYES